MFAENVTGGGEAAPSPWPGAWLRWGRWDPGPPPAQRYELAESCGHVSLKAAAGLAGPGALPGRGLMVGPSWYEDPLFALA